MEGDLYQHVMHALRNPEKRILGATKGTHPDGPRVLSKTFGNRLKVARKFDIDDALLERVFQEPSWAELTKDNGNLPIKTITRNVVEAEQELRLPFKDCWIEFNAKTYNAHVSDFDWATGLVGVSGTVDRLFEFEKAGIFLTEKFDGQIDMHLFFSLDGDNRIYMAILGRSVRNGPTEKPLSEVGIRHVSLLMYGVDFQNEPLSEACSDYLDLLHNSRLHQMREVFGNEYTDKAFENFVEPWAPYYVRISWEILRVLNYPWVVREQARFERSKKGRSPKVTPRDSYYRCKIKLPKPNGVETRQLEPRDEAYGKRLHQVRGHWRVYRDEHGDFVKRTWIREHRRGDAKLGVVLKDYVLTGEGTSSAQKGTSCAQKGTSCAQTGGNVSSTNTSQPTENVNG
jgi:hypothetical protein